MTAFPSTPPGIVEPLPDPSQPLANARHERMAQLRAQGRTQRDAFALTQRPGEGPRDPGPPSSLIFSRPEVRARVEYLTDKARAGMLSCDETEAKPDAPQRTRRPADKAGDEEQNAPITKDEIERKLAYAVRTGETKDIVQAAKLLVDMRPELGAGDAQSSRNPDPVSVIQYVTTFAGMDGQAIVAQLGGWAFLRSKLCDVLRVSEGELLQGLTHGCVTPSGSASPAP